MNIKKKSKFLSLILRHKPEIVGITLDANGWVNVKELLEKTKITQEQLDKVLEQQATDKQRFDIKDDGDGTGTHIRANQGHSIEKIDLGLENVEPPIYLYHGTSTEAEKLIMVSGRIDKMKRHDVHLSESKNTSNEVGMRNGSPIVLVIDSRAMHIDGHIFQCSKNGVWLTKEVPIKYIVDRIKV
jgi:putative RNA 2'-phosphotransferase